MRNKADKISLKSYVLEVRHQEVHECPYEEVGAMPFSLCTNEKMLSTTTASTTR